MVALTVAEALVGQEALAEEPHPVVLVPEELVDQLVAAVAVLAEDLVDLAPWAVQVEALEAVLALSQVPPEASVHLAWMQESPSKAPRWSTCSSLPGLPSMPAERLPRSESSVGEGSFSA